MGYHLFPYFGGNRKAPHDIYIDIHYNADLEDSEYANFSFSRPFPNPLNNSQQGNIIKIEVTTAENEVPIGLNIYSLTGEQVGKVQAQPVAPNSSKILKFIMPLSLASGTYIISPYGIKNGATSFGVNLHKGARVRGEKFIWVK